MTGVSVSTLTRWQKDGHLVPERFQDYGKVRVWLYTEHQVEEIMMNPPYRPTGRPAKKETQ